jgi:hypothetical protein
MEHDIDLHDRLTIEDNTISVSNFLLSNRETVCLAQGGGRPATHPLFTRCRVA